MAYREKQSWLTLSAIIVAYVIYFGFVGPAYEFGRERLLDIIISFGMVAAAHGVFSIFAHLALWLSTPKADRAKPDERDRNIARHGGAISYWILLIGLLWVGVAMPFYEEAWVIINVALAFVVGAEILKDIVILVSYRRGWHA